MNVNLTQEEIQLNISAAFDSVNLINRNEDSQNVIEMNIEHLRIMMGKNWFVESLTPEQLEQINTIINE